MRLQGDDCDQAPEGDSLPAFADKNSRPVPPAFDSTEPVHSDALMKRLQHDEPMTWIFAGDSDFCSTPQTAETFPRLVADWTKSEFGRQADIYVNATYANARLEHVRHRMQIRFTRFEPDVVTLVCGFADCAGGVEKCDEFEQSLIGIIKDVQKIGAMPVVCTPPYSEANEGTDEHIDHLIFIEAIRGCAAEHSAILVDHWRFWENQTNTEDLWDREHQRPTAVGILQMHKLFLHEMGIERCVTDPEIIKKTAADTVKITE